MKLCISTFVSKEYYHQYIPFYIYSIKKTYPDYFVKIFVKEKLDRRAMNNIKLIESAKDSEITLKGFEVIEDFFSVFPNDANGNIAKGLRWCLPGSLFKGFEYVYIGDIDVFVLPERKDLLSFHLDQALYFKLPYSNCIRPENPYRMSGLHFVSEEYFKIVEDTQKRFIEYILSSGLKNFRNPYSGHQDNEYMLFRLIIESGLKLPYPPVWDRPKHGIHTGEARIEGRMREVFLRPDDYEFFRELVQFYLYDEVFWEMIENSSDQIQLEWAEIFEKGFERAIEVEDWEILGDLQKESYKWRKFS